MHGEYFEMIPATLFFLAIAFIDTTVFIAFNYIQQLSIMRAFGFSNATPASFLCSRLTNILAMTIALLPLILFAMVIIINFRDNLTLAFMVGTVFGKMWQLMIFPRIKCLDKQRVPFPDERSELRRKICEFAEREGYPDPENKIMLTLSRLGDLHSNASVNSRHIDLSRELLEHHNDHDEEIVAITAHELGHWQQSHLYVAGLWDVLYMTVCGWFLQRCLNDPYLLRAFGFEQESIFISIYLFYKVYSCSLDYPQRKLFNVLYRSNEYKADKYAA